MSKRTSLDLSGVPQTLLLPLMARATFCQESYSPIQDKKAIEIVNALDYDFKHLSEVKQVKSTMLFLMARAFHFDEAIRAHIAKYPKCVVVNLGAGLDTAFSRVGNGEITWIDLDVPEVIKLREKLLPPSLNEHYIAKSILDFSWMDDVKEYGDDVFFFAGGLFMYFNEDQIKSILLAIGRKFPDADIIFDNTSPKGIMYANQMLQRSGMKDALLRWGIYDAKELEKWSPRIKLITKKPYFSEIKSRFRFPWSIKFRMYFFDSFHKSGIIHLKLG